MSLSKIARYKSDFILLVLTLESFFLWLAAAEKGLFWLFFVISIITATILASAYFKLTILEILKSPRLPDILFFILLVLVFNVNIVIIPHILILLLALIFYFFGMKYFLKMIKKENSSQAQKNVIVLATLIILFFGSNLFTTITLNISNGSNSLALLVITLCFFAFIYLISKYSFEKNKVISQITKVYSLAISIILCELFVVFSFFSEKYPNLKQGNTAVISISVASLFIVLVYYCIWGLLIHKLEDKLNFRIIFEYVGITFVIIMTLILTIKWV